MALNFVLVLHFRAAESSAKEASEKAVTAQDELDEGREAVFEAKRKVEEIQKMLERAKEALEVAEKKVKQAVLDVKATSKVIRVHFDAWPSAPRCETQLERATREEVHVHHYLGSRMDLEPSTLNPEPKTPNLET